MNKLIISIPLSLILGGAAGFFAAKKIYEKKYEAIAQEEIDSVKEMFAKKFDDYTSEVKERLNVATEKPVETVKPANNAATRGPIKYNASEQAKQDYHLITKKYDTVDHEDETDTDEDVNEEDDDDEVRDEAGYSESDMKELARVDRTQPYIISDTEFSEERLDYDKVSLCYYRADDVLCEENEKIIDDIDNSVGWDALHALDMQSSIWVRNEPLGIDYEIISLNRSYAEATGLGPRKVMTPRERYEKERRDKDAE